MRRSAGHRPSRGAEWPTRRITAGSRSRPRSAPDVLLLNGFAGQRGRSRSSSSSSSSAWRENATKSPSTAPRRVGHRRGRPARRQEALLQRHLRAGRRQGARDADFTGYRLEIVPQFWLLDPEDPEPDLPAHRRPGHPEEGADGPGRHVRDPGHLRAARLLRAVPRVGLRLRQPPHGRGRASTTSSSTATAATQMVVAEHARGATRTCPASSQLIYEDVDGGDPRRGPRHRLGEGARSCARARPRSGTTASSCRTSTWRPTSRSRTPSPVGKVTHKLKLGGEREARALRLPGATPSASTAIDKGGGDQPAELQKIFQDNKRTAEIRMQEEAAASVLDPRRRATAGSSSPGTSSPSSGTSTPTARTSSTTVEHVAPRPPTTAPASGGVQLPEQFTCIPAALCRSARRASTPKPGRAGDADGGRRRPHGRGDLHRQVRPREGPVPLGPRGQERRRQLVLGPRRHSPGPGKQLGRHPSGRGSARR